ncbi:MAG: PHP domain-containing protein [Candidatus Omnitrophica bacterium]|nr:PHP domain-containing protein [Candidatus Omnitrophota bacterium]
MKYADLHLHTIFSDGIYTPETLVRRAHKVGLSACAVVDHDTLEGIPYLFTEAKKFDLELIPGIELTAAYEGTEIHILGYYLEYDNRQLADTLVQLKKDRKVRAEEIIEKLHGIGVGLRPEAVFDLAGQGVVGRLHVARALLQEGLVGSLAEAFQRYIGDKSPAYVLGFRFSPAQAIALIRDAGGIAVLAHPYILKNDDLIPRFVDEGLQGLEVHYPEHSQSMVNFYLGIARKYNLLVTGGSDCHGDAKSEIKMGSLKVDYELVEKLKEARVKR